MKYTAQELEKTFKAAASLRINRLKWKQRELTRNWNLCWNNWWKQIDKQQREIKNNKTKQLND